MTALTRRALIGGIGGIAGSLAAGCSRPGGIPGVVRIGYLANLSHAPMIAGIASGRIAAALGGLRVETRVFRAGPRVVEALVGRAIDIGVSGPAPIVIAHARHGPGMLSILGGCASGGASFLVARDPALQRPQDLNGRVVASTQLGSTQDVALRKYLREHGLDAVEHGGRVNVVALAPADVLLQMRRGEIAGAWLPEPWGTRAEMEIGAARWVDERDRWPNHAFPASLLVARSDYMSAQPAILEQVTRATRDEVTRALTNPQMAEEEAYDGIRSLTGNAGARPIFHRAIARVDFTSDPLRSAVDTFAADACALGLIPRVQCESLFSRS